MMCFATLNAAQVLREASVGRYWIAAQRIGDGSDIDIFVVEDWSRAVLECIANEKERFACNCLAGHSEGRLICINAHRGEKRQPLLIPFAAVLELRFGVKSANQRNRKNNCATFIAKCNFTWLNCFRVG